jgi:hypothetical protein
MPTSLRALTIMNVFATSDLKLLQWVIGAAVVSCHGCTFLATWVVLLLCQDDVGQRSATGR